MAARIPPANPGARRRDDEDGRNLYASPEDLATLALSPRALEGVSEADQLLAIAAASSYADGYLRARYRMPLVSWGQDLTLCVAQLAAYSVMNARGYDPSSPHDQLIVKQYDDAVAWLRDVAKGLVTPGGGPDGGGIVEAPNSGPSLPANQRVVF